MGLSEKKYINAVLEAPNTRKDRYTVLNELDLSEELVKHALNDIQGKLTG